MAKNNRKKRKGRICSLTKEGKELLRMKLSINKAFPNSKDAQTYIKALLQRLSEQTTETI